MNQQELTKIASGLAEVKEPTLVEAPADQRTMLIVIRANGRMTPEGREAVRARWLEAVKGTAFENIRTVIIDEQFTVEFHQTDVVKPVTP